MIKRFHSVENIAWFVDLIDRGQLILDPPYQRKSVWTLRYKRFFIDTIIRDYPAPPIFLNQEISPDGKSTYYLIDGRQRLESILGFVKNEIAIPENFGDTTLNGKYFDELQAEHKKGFWEYRLSVETYTNANVELVKESFDRLNRNVLKLTPQELRHAKFDGRFITLVTELSDDIFWSDIKISTITRSRRMKDVEFISELFLLTMLGVESYSNDSLDKHYADYDDEIPNEEKHRKNFDKVKQILLKINLDIPNTRFVNYAEFYSLWGALLNFRDKEINYAETTRKINSFLNRLEEYANLNIEHKPKYTDKDIIKYSETLTVQPNKKPKRETRIKIISKYIVV